MNKFDRMVDGLTATIIVFFVIALANIWPYLLVIAWYPLYKYLREEGMELNRKMLRIVKSMRRIYKVVRGKNNGGRQ